MQRSDDTSVPVQEQLAREWRMYESVESGEADALYIIWEAPRPVVVLGRGNRLDDWVDAERCRHDGIDVLRRSSGGGAVVLAPGCLNYAVCLSLDTRPALADVEASFRAVHEQLITALAVPRLMIAGVADLAWSGLKVSGNAQRRGRRAVLHHGTLLYGFDAELAHRYLREPPRQPAYRARRTHRSFLGNLPLSARAVAGRVASALGILAHSSPLMPCAQVARDQ
jgi:lipoate-protein ligase A